MINLVKISDLDVNNKRVLVRLDLDIKEFNENDLRLTAATKTLDYLKGKASEITIIAHRGRPDGKVVPELSLKVFQSYFDKWGARVEENLRFDKGEEENNPDFIKKLATLGDVFINDAFANSHRNHASIVGLPKLMPSVFGFHFLEEIENLSRDFSKPVVVVISGIKEDKVEMAKKLSDIYDKVLVGGRLPEYFGDEGLESVRNQDEKLVIGNLTQDREDITLNTIEKFKSELSYAETVILAGVLGKYEDEGHMQGTKEIFEYISKLSAFKIAGGGDTETAITTLNLSDKFDWISVGGGAMLEFLSHKTLPAIEAIIK
ncbi:MAG: Phosphoglycerate kinase [Candidatus Woesebacteria bacterium GW2011_GWA1_33_30]|uniref:phosphoglycerate kinase n=1 Tax=Candidatus Woesebacteria bacterium GW2011_GWA2_33_28 TaxID=1618561 RepID=A0A0F9ZSJ3_9BACT|nr:MAG: Phosphoglycerate kinase [Candidatus Woesebacteria bacterium GW2011_GWA2_33_28]KKP48164.1 MAG: Phosphoglycerate kinase [Candidatus Woesebacteria bacterium GW2011_GWA1_33_30]KKP49406.1 MAG: Phosphoglycerate kinase [Microgenomates group bacterium GW2011_GWC1_33_32]KKP52132.1 MAG: Phosphoglycerate kinase [Candidatus Woesebacteria bacterium GW2011_GWB1_33_38]